MKTQIKEYWQKAKPSLKVYGSVTWMLTKIGIVFAIAAILGGAGIGTGAMVGALEDVPAFDRDALENPFLPSYIYDINGNLITEVHDAQNRIPIKMDDVPDHLRDAFLAAEDNSFFTHPGFDLKGLGRAVYTNLVSGSSQGASTITQQVVKQVYLNPKKKLSRKLQELYIAVLLERQYTKNEIFEFYINNATFYDNNAWGVEAAAQTYFGKSASEVTLGEAAMLAGIPNNPSYFSPHPDDMEPALKRRNDVLMRMIRFGYITEAEAEAAMAEEPVLKLEGTNKWPYPHYIDAVVHTYAIDDLMTTGLYETKDDAAQAIRRDGLHIYTALDPRVQQVMQDVMFDDKYYPKDTFVYPEGHKWAGRRYPQGTAIVMGVEKGKEGYVLGMVGGREYDSTNKLNRYKNMFQPGSAIKPVVVYGPAFEMGILSPGSVLDDAPTAWPGEKRDYTPENYASTFRGLVTVREAIRISDNIPALKAYEKVMQTAGAKSAVQFAQRLGITGYGERMKNNPRAYSQLGIAIGSQEVTPLEMTQAFSAFANQGKTSKPLFVTKILDRNGVEIFSATPHSEVVIKEETAFLVTSVLRDVVTKGTAYPSKLTKYQVAAKTGTTDDAHDRWTVGYSSKYVFTVWLGNDNKQAIVDGKTVKIPGTSNAGYNRINDMFGAIVRGTIGDDDVPFNPAPSGVTRVTVCKKSGLHPSTDCPPEDIITDWFLKGSEPKDICNIHVRLAVCADSGLLATEYCPSVVERVFYNRPPFILTDERWNGRVGRGPADANNLPPTEECTAHGPNAITYSLDVTPFSGGMSLNWTTPPSYSGFNVYRRDFAGTEFSKITPGPIFENQYFDQFQALPGMSYEYRITVIDLENQEVQRHNDAKATRPLELYLKADYTGDKVVVNWTPPEANLQGGKIENYKIYRDGTAIGSPGQNTYTDKNVEPGKTYEYRISVVYKIRGVLYESGKTDPTSITVPEASDGGDNNDDDGGTAHRRLSFSIA